MHTQYIEILAPLQVFFNDGELMSRTITKIITKTKIKASTATINEVGISNRKAFVAANCYL